MKTRRKALEHREIFSDVDAALAQFSQICLYFSLLAGNLVRRLVRTGLRRQAGVWFEPVPRLLESPQRVRAWFDQGITYASTGEPAAQTR